MKYKKLGEKGPLVSTVGFGAWGISGRDWGKTDDILSKKSLHEALDKGVNFIDTADVYGFGHSEKLIGEVLKERGGKKDIVIATKAGNNFYPYIGGNYDTTPYNPDYSVKHLSYAVDQSLKRLNIEVIDILQLHSPDTEILNKDEPWLALEKLKQQGKILHGGLSVRSFEESKQAYLLDLHNDIIDVIQVRYNILEREAEEILLPKAMNYKMGVIIRIPLLFGFLTGKFNKDHVFGEDDHRKFNLSTEKLNDYFISFQGLESLYNNYPNFKKSQVSLAFCISHPACQTVIPGCKTPEQANENILASDFEFDRNLLEQ